MLVEKHTIEDEAPSGRHVGNTIATTIVSSIGAACYIVYLQVAPTELFIMVIFVYQQIAPMGLGIA